MLAAGLALLSVSTIAACGGQSAPNGNSLEHQQQQRDSTSLLYSQPVPGFTFSQLRANLIEIETAQAMGVQTTSFFFNQGARDPIQSCPSIGAPIASTTQLTNPDQVIHDGYARGAALTVAQMDPTGVYSGNSTGTYVMCVGADGKPYADYWEGFVQTIFGPATWDYNTHQVRLVGPPSFRFSK
jgi:hypothetical protein